MDLILDVKGLSKRYNTFSLEDVGFSVPKGSIMGFIGENGSGKTTTIKAILELIKKDAGEVKLFDQLIPLKNIEVREDIGVVLDAPNFPDFVTIEQIDKMMRNIFKRWNTNQYYQLIEQFNLPKGKAFKEFSKGMQMKLAIAVALSHHAKLLILDEPTSGLDPIVRDEILDIFLDFIQDEEHSIFVSSHIIGDLEKVADYITFLHQGKVVFSMSKDDLLTEYGIIHCTNNDFETIDKDAIVGYRRNSFGVEVLVKKKYISKAIAMEKANIEQIMLLHVKGERE